MEIRVRNLEPDDFLTLWQSNLYPLIKERDTIYLEIIQQQREFCFIAEVSEKRFGGIVVAGRGSQSAFIYHLWVHPDLEGLGLGTELVRHLEQAVSEAGLEYVWCFTTESDGFYKHLGYTDDSSIFSGSALDHIRKVKRTKVMLKRL